MAVTETQVAALELERVIPKIRVLFERDDTFYVAHPLWVLFAQSGKARIFARKPRGSEAAMVVGTQTLVDRIEAVLACVGEWGSVHCDGKSMPYLLETRRAFDIGGAATSRFEMTVPAISFKTDYQMHRRTPHDPEGKVRELPYWGTAEALIARYSG